MRLEFRIALVLLAVPLAGCIGSNPASQPADTASVPEAAPHIETDRGSVTGTDALVITGQRLQAESGEQACGASNCERIDLSLDLPSDYWETREGGLEVSVRQEDPGARYEARLVGPDGAVTERSRWASYAGTLLFDEPGSNNYTVEVVALSGSGTYEVAIQLEAGPEPEGPTRDVLPNLVTLPPLDLEIERPYGPVDAPVAKGCTPHEAAEEGARRCLRFTNTVANLGEGALEVRLTFEEGAKAVADSGRFVQRIDQSDGTHREEPVAGAQFHATHSHWHYEDFAGFELYRYEPDTGQRGELVRDQSESGFCFFDMGLPELDHNGTTPPVYRDEANCFTQPEEDWVTGLSPGWYDMYWSSLDDQYIDISDLDDGVYELVTTADAQGSLIQTTRADDEAGAVFRLDGDDVEVLERWSAGTDAWTER